MADLEKTVSVIFQGTDNLSGKLKSISRNVDQFAGDIQSATQPLADLAKNVLQVEAALVALSVGGLVYAFNKSKEFEGASIELRKVLGEEIDLLDEAEKAAMGFSDQYGESATDILRSTAQFKQAGFEVEEAMLLTKNALDLVIAGELEAAEASEILVAVLKGFKAPASEAARLIDILNEVSNKYATNIEQLGVGMAQLSPIARTMGFSMEETAGILTPVIEIFRSGEEAATALKMGLLKLIDDAVPVREALASIGVSQTDANGRLRSGRDILLDVATAFRTLDQDQKLFVTSQLVGIRQAAKMVEVFDGLAITTEVTAVALGAAGSAAEEVTLRLESSEVAVNRLKEGFVNLAITMGDKYRESAKGVIDGTTAIENAFATAIRAGTFDPIFDAIDNFGVKVAKDLQKIADIMPEALEKVEFEGLVASFENLGVAVKEAFSALFGDVDLTTAEGLSEAIQKVVDAVTALTNISAGIIEAWEPLIELLSKGIDKFSATDESTKSWIGNLLGTFQIINKLTGVLTIFSSGLGSVASAFTAVGAIKYLGIAAGVGAVASAFGLFLVGGAIGAGLVYVIDKLSDFVTKADEIPTDIELTLTLDSGNVLELATGIIRDIEGKVISIPYDWLEKEPPKSSSVLMQELLDEGRTDAEITYAMNPSMENLDAAVKSLGGGVIKTVDDTLQLITDLPGKIEPLELIKIDKSMIETELTEIKTQAATVQTAMEWTAQMDITDTLAAAAVMQAAFEASAVTVEALAASTADMVGTLAGIDTSAGFDTYRDILEFTEKQQEMEKIALDVQNKLMTAQTALIEAQTAARERGDALITINGEGLQPHLEAFMWEILEAIQIRASEEGAEYLLGVGA